MKHKMKLSVVGDRSDDLVIEMILLRKETSVKYEPSVRVSTDKNGREINKSKCCNRLVLSLMKC